MKYLNQHKIGIIIAVILGLIFGLYLGGLLGQLFAGYQIWLEQDGLSGNVAMPPVRPYPLYCILFAFTPAGLKATLFIFAATGGIALYAKLRDKFGGKHFDDRNFSVSDKGTYGTAAWMSDKEMKSVLQVSTPEKATGIILGQKNNAVICLPEDTHLNKHIAVFGASGTLKSRGFVRPYLFQSIKRGESVIITDPKSELYHDTAELFRQNGYHVKVFNLVDPQFGDSWNCMADLNGDTLMAQILTDVIISNTSQGKGDHFWDNGEGNLLKSLVLLVDQDASRGMEAKHLPAVYQLLTQNGERQLSTMFDKLPIHHPAKAPYSLFSQASDTVRAGIILGLGTRLQVLQNEAVRKITSHSDIDLTEPARQKCAYFIIISDQERALDFLSSLFFSFLFIKLIRFADKSPGGRCPIPVNMVFDELNNVGKINNFSGTLSVTRSRQIQICMVTQNLAQLQNRYPDNQWSELVGNADTQLMLGCTDEITADFFSLRSGDLTVEVNSTMTVRKTLAVAQIIPQYRHTEGLGRRRLLTPDEVLRLPNDEVLIVLRGQKMLKAEKFDYTGHPYANSLRPAPICEYQSQRHSVSPPCHTDFDKEPSHAVATHDKKDAPKIPPQPGLYQSALPPEEF